MKLSLGKENTDAEQLIPPAAPDSSGIGINYIDAYIKPINTTLEDGQKITCRRVGLKILLSIGDTSGEAIIQRVDHGPDVRNMLREALRAASQKAGAEFVVEDHCMYLDT